MDNTYYLLKSMLGTTTVSIISPKHVQVMVDQTFPLNNIHYELYNNHVELHVEDRSETYIPLCSFLRNYLPNNEIAKTERRGFCIYAYVLNRRVEGLSNIAELGEAFLELQSIVKPVLEKYFERIAENFQLAEALGEYYEKQKALLPFHINIIDELHANENAHTRILTQLLKYKEEGKRVFLLSFLKQLPTFNTDAFDIEKAEVYYNREYIDCLIEKEGDFAVIIENKIHWAADQDKQIERYVTTEITNGIPADNIWVIYLTRDGGKKVEEYSLTPQTKEILKDRFVEMNYRHNILPWLKDSILPNCKLKEEWLVLAVKQYIDHLEGLFDMREYQKDFRKKIQSRIAKSIGCTETMSRVEIYSVFHSYKQTLNELQNIVSNSIESLVKPITDRLANVTAEIIGELCPNDEICFNNAIQYGFFQVRFNKWMPDVHFEWFPLDEKQLFQGKEYALYLHVERNDIKEFFRNVWNDDELVSKAEEIGLYIDSHDSRVFYKKVICTEKSMADMTHTEFVSFLREAYKDVNDVQQFVTDNILSQLS